MTRMFQPGRGGASGGAERELAAARDWLPAMAFDTNYVGICPIRNAATLLNRPAAFVWDTIRATRNEAAAAQALAAAIPGRREIAQRDVALCLTLWREAGLFGPVPVDGPVPMVPLPSSDAGIALDRQIAVGGETVRVRVADPALGAALSDMLTDFPDVDGVCGRAFEILGSDAGGWLLTENGEPAASGASRSAMRGALMVSLLHAAADESGWLAILHAACLTDGEQTVLLAAPSGSGKSTLAAQMIADGWCLVAEDLVPLRPDLSAVALPFALSIKQGSWPIVSAEFPRIRWAQTHRFEQRILRYVSLPPEQRSNHPVRPNAILFPHFAANAAARTEALAPADVLSRLLGEEAWVDFARPEARGFLRWVERTPAYSLHYASGSEALGQIRSLLGRDETAPSSIGGAGGA
ncbi:MAG: PqqD family peptide modification chaperone [Pseudomonadota bacterium]